MCVSFWKRATELALPVDETHLPGGGRAESRPVQGVESLEERKAEKEQAQPAQWNESLVTVCTTMCGLIWWYVCMYVATVCSIL